MLTRVGVAIGHDRRGGAGVSFAGYSLTAFASAYLVRTREMSLGEVGVQYGIASGLTGIVGLLVVGRIADRLSAKDPRWLLWLVGVMIAALLPFSALAFSDALTADMGAMALGRALLIVPVAQIVTIGC